MAYIGNIGSLLKSVYVRDKSPIKKRLKSKTVKHSKNISKLTYVNPIVEPVVVYAKIEPTVNDRLKEIRDRYSEEIKMHGEQTSIKEGFVYLVGNRSYPGWIKAGMTIDFENRLTQYNVYDPLDGFEMHYIKWTDDRRYKENLLLSAIGEEAVCQKGEWFYIDEKQAIEIFETI